MKTVIPLLQNVKVAAPCPASWEGMEIIDGDRVHFCAGCKKNVYNLSSMSQSEAEGLLRKHEGHLCVRYYQRRDGTVLTKDCPVGVQAVRLMFIRRSVTAAALMLLYFTGFAMYAANRPHAMGTPVQTVDPHPLMGDVAAPTPPTKPVVETPPPPMMPTMGAVAMPIKQGQVQIHQGRRAETKPDTDPKDHDPND